MLGLALVGASAAEDRSVDVSDAEELGRAGRGGAARRLAAVPLARLPGCSRRRRPRRDRRPGVRRHRRRRPDAARRPRPDRSAASSATLLRSPATYALVAAGVLAMLTYSIALQRGTVTQATAPLVVGETVAPALVGLLLLGDQARPGWGWVAVVGFALAVAGAVSLARHGELEAASAAPGT